MMSLLVLPPELLAHVCSYLLPADIVALGSTCHHAQDLTKPNNSILWHCAFLQIFDDPQKAFSLKPGPEPSEDDHPATYWYKKLKRWCSAIKATSPSANKPLEYYDLFPEQAIETRLEIIDFAKPGPTDAEIARGVSPQTDDRRSLNLQVLSPRADSWGRVENLIHDCHSDAEEESDLSSTRRITRSLSLARKSGPRSDAAKRLHVLYGRTGRERVEHGHKGRARQILYNWNTPVEENEYGPFLKDGSGNVDWTVLEACATLMLRHFEMGADGRISTPNGFCYSIPCRTLPDPTVPDDWAHVTGNWLGTYSYLDYADLFNYNVGHTTGTQSSTLENIPETHGDLMLLELKLDSSLKEDGAWRFSSDFPRNEELPHLYFSGVSKSFDPYGSLRGMIRIEGCVSLLPSGREVRWKYIISYGGQEQWKLEGVQPGGVRSGPVYGNWTQWGHEENAPVGGFIYVREELCKKQSLVLVR